MNNAADKINIENTEEKSLFSSLMDNIIGEDGEIVKDSTFADLTGVEGEAEFSQNNGKLVTIFCNSSTH